MPERDMDRYFCSDLVDWIVSGDCGEARIEELLPWCEFLEKHNRMRLEHLIRMWESCVKGRSAAQGNAFARVLLRLLEVSPSNIQIRFHHNVWETACCSDAGWAGQLLGVCLNTNREEASPYVSSLLEKALSGSESASEAIVGLLQRQLEPEIYKSITLQLMSDQENPMARQLLERIICTSGWLVHVVGADTEFQRQIKERFPSGIGWLRIILPLVCKGTSVADFD
jgi:hypothetical protein